MRKSILTGTLVLALAACGGADIEGDGPRPSDRAPAGGGAGAPGTGPGGGTTETPSGPGSGTKPGGEPTGDALKKLGSLVVLGDSISDGGGVAPFYYDRLRQMLSAKFGTIVYANEAESGSKTDALAGQIGRLPRTLPGPVAVCITSGGNDMKAQVQAIMLGMDGAARSTMAGNVRQALSALLAPGRFGAGVSARVFEANIYDASDGKGDYGQHGCAFGRGLPAMPSDGFFGSWNGAITQEVTAKGQQPMDIHARFRGHGYAGAPNWYASDCTHPNGAGHGELAQFFFDEITKKDF